MPTFTYRARKKASAGTWVSVEGTVTAASHEEVMDLLERQGMMVQTILDEQQRAADDSGVRIGKALNRKVDPLGLMSLFDRIGHGLVKKELESYLAKSGAEPAERRKWTLRRNRFKFVARESDGETWRQRTGSILGVTREEVMEALTAQGFKVQAIYNDDPWANFRDRLTLRTRPKAVNLLAMTQRFAAMLGAGLPVIRVIRCLGEQEDDAVLRMALIGVERKVEIGTTLSKAFAQFPKVFPPIYVALIRVAETTGNLPGQLKRLYELLEHDYHLRQKAKAAMVYPTFVMAAALIIMVGLFQWVLPPLLDTCAQLSNGHLPLPTVIIMSVSQVLNMPLTWGFLLVMAVWFIFWYRQFSQTDHGRRAIDRVKLNGWLIGPLNCKILLARLCNAWSALVASGYPVMGSLEVLNDFCGNEYFKTAVIEPLAKSLVRGAGLAGGCADIPVHLMPPLAVSMLEVGEDTGQLDEMLSKLAKYYMEEVSHQLQAFLALIEPVMIFILGFLVGLIVLSVFLPLYQLVTQL